MKYLDKKHGKGKYIYKPRTDEGAGESMVRTNTLIHSKGKNINLKEMRESPSDFIGQKKLDIQKEFRESIQFSKDLSRTIYRFI